MKSHTQEKLGTILLAIGIFLIGGLYAFILMGSDTLAGDGGLDAKNCSVVASTTVVIGNQSSTEIVAENSRNAYVIIRQPVSATNTVALGFGAAADVAINGFKLAPTEVSTATSSPDSLILGLNTDFPYTGAISARTNAGSTTIGVTICRY